MIENSFSFHPVLAQLRGHVSIRIVYFVLDWSLPTGHNRFLNRPILELLGALPSNLTCLSSISRRGR